MADVRTATHDWLLLLLLLLLVGCMALVCHRSSSYCRRVNALIVPLGPRSAPLSLLGRISLDVPVIFPFTESYVEGQLLTLAA